MNGPLGTTPLLPVQPGKLANASYTIWAVNRLAKLAADSDITWIHKYEWAC